MDVQNLSTNTQNNDDSSFEYEGSVSSLYVIYFKNLFLNIITFFIYKAWAKTRVRKYLWSKIKINGHALVYTGTGKELFKGFVKVAFVYFIVSLLLSGIVYMAATNIDTSDVEIDKDVTEYEAKWALGLCGHKDFDNLTNRQVKECLSKHGFTDSIGFIIVNIVDIILTYFLILFILYFAKFSALRYRLSRTTWCGIGGLLTGSGKSYALLSFRRLFINIITLGMAVPKSDMIKQQYISNNMYLGDKKATFDFNVGNLQATNMITLILAIPTLGFSRLWYIAKLRNQKLANVSFENISFAGTFTAGGYLKLSLINLLLILFTLGLATPFVINRILRFNVDNIQIIGDFNQLTVSRSQDGDNAGNVGEGIEHNLDVDAGVDIDFGII